MQTDLEKAASGASGACGLFVINPAILRIFSVKHLVLFSLDGGRRVEDGELRLDKGDLRLEDGEWRVENSKLRLHGQWTWIEERQSCHFEDIVKL